MTWLELAVIGTSATLIVLGITTIIGEALDWLCRWLDNQ